MGKILCLIPSTPCLFCYVLEFWLIFSKFNPCNPQIQSAAWSSINLLKTDQDGCLNPKKTKSREVQCNSWNNSCCFQYCLRVLCWSGVIKRLTVCENWNNYKLVTKSDNQIQNHNITSAKSYSKRKPQWIKRDCKQRSGPCCKKGGANCVVTDDCFKQH